ncbi:MAG: hypothetical protein IIC95_00655 [Chloroflexi bacterium]|nr:hypothetical protein [Chloroflexota bacterium]
MNLKHRLIQVLSDPDIQDGEFQRVISWLTKGGLAEWISDAQAIRRLLVRYGTDTKDDGPRRSALSSESLIAEIDQLLRREAHMTAREALEQLARVVRFKRPLRDRISFADGILQMARSVGASSVLDAANQIVGSPRMSGTVTAAARPRPSPVRDDSLIDEVARLLRIEARMTARDALEELADGVGFDEPLRERIAFAEGVRRIAREVTESRVLSVASQIRNEKVHGFTAPAWPLK